MTCYYRKSANCKLMGADCCSISEYVGSWDVHRMLKRPIQNIIEATTLVYLVKVGVRLVSVPPICEYSNISGTRNGLSQQFDTVVYKKTVSALKMCPGSGSLKAYPNVL